MFPIEYILAAILGIVALLIIVLTLYYRNRNLFFQVSRDTNTYRVNGRYLIYIMAIYLIISAGIQALANFQPRYQRMIQMIDSMISILLIGIVVAFIAGVQNLYALIALGGIIVAFIGCGFWFTQIFIPGNRFSGVIPLGLALILICIYLTIVYMSWNDNRSRYGTTWPITTVAMITIACLIMLAMPVLQMISFQNQTLDMYLVPMFNTASKVIFSGLLTYGVLTHVEP